MTDPLVELSGKLGDLHRVDLGNRVTSVCAEQIANSVDNVHKCNLAGQPRIFRRSIRRRFHHEGLPTLDCHIFSDDWLSPI